METSYPAVMLQCIDCGHNWKPRNTPGKARECSKCGSKNIEEVDPNGASEEDQDQKRPRSSLRMISSNEPPPVDDEFRDDPDVKALRKELVMAELNQQIGAVSPRITDNIVFSRFSYDLKFLIRSLHQDGRLNSKTYGQLFYKCPWCGEGNMRRKDADDGAFILTCSECGRTVP